MTLPKQPLPALLEPKDRRDPVPITNSTHFEIDMPPIIFITIDKKGKVNTRRAED